MKKVSKILILSLLVFSFVFSCCVPAFAVLQGDVDKDGNISASDARKVLRASVSLEKLTAEQTAIADVDNTPGISASDARIILRASVNLEELGEMETEHTHDYKITEVLYEAICTARGRVELTCSCGDEKKEYTPKLGHDYVKSGEDAPTCVKTGKTYYECTRCYDEKSETINKIAHNHEITDTKKATCTTNGRNTLTCTVCGNVKLETIEATGHDYVNNICKYCNKPDPSYCEELSIGEKWVVDGNWELTVTGVKYHRLCNSISNANRGYTDEQVAIVYFTVKNIGFTSSVGGSGLIVTPLSFEVYDEMGHEADVYSCANKYVSVAVKGMSASGATSFVLHNDSDSISFYIELTDKNGNKQKALFSGPINGSVYNCP